MSMRIALAAAAVSALIAAGPASAHVTLQPSEAPAGEFVRLDVRVPSERDDANTTKVRVQFPPGFLFISHEPVPGWEVTVDKRKLAQPAEAFGEQIDEEVGEVTFAASRDEGIAPGQFRDFGLSLRMPESADTPLTFKALQTYDNGEVVRWIGPPDAEEPAPQVELTAGEAEVSPTAVTSAESGGDGDGDDGASTGLAIAALALGGLGLATALAALASSRRSRRVAAGHDA